MLNLLEPFDLKSMGPQSAEALHLMIEAKKLAYEDRAKFYADPDFRPLPIATLISKPYANRRRAELNPDKANLHPIPGDPAQADTIYLTVVDQRLQLRQPDPEQFPRLRVASRAARPGLRDPEPRVAVRTRPEASEPARAAQAPVPDDHPRLRHQGRPALAQLRLDGRATCRPRAMPR